MSGVDPVTVALIEADGIAKMEEVAKYIAASTGGLSFHAVEGGWCVHVGPHNRYLGCTHPSIVLAILHAFSNHVDRDSGAPLAVVPMTPDNRDEKNHPEEGDET